MVYCARCASLVRVGVRDDLSNLLTIRGAERFSIAATVSDMPPYHEIHDFFLQRGGVDSGRPAHDRLL